MGGLRLSASRLFLGALILFLGGPNGPPQAGSVYKAVADHRKATEDLRDAVAAALEAGLRVEVRDVVGVSVPGCGVLDTWTAEVLLALPEGPGA